MARGVYNYFVRRGKITTSKPKVGCDTVSKGTKIKYPKEPDVRLRHCKTLKKPKTKKAKKAKKRKQPKYKGHRTSRGLKQDMRLKSQEKHEKAYRKQKRKSKR